MTLTGLSNRRYQQVEEYVLDYLNKNGVITIPTSEWHQSGKQYNIYADMDIDGIDGVLTTNNEDGSINTNKICPVAIRTSHVDFFIRIKREYIKDNITSRLQCEYDHIKECTSKIFIYIKPSETNIAVFIFDLKDLGDIEQYEQIEMCENYNNGLNRVTMASIPEKVIRHHSSIIVDLKPVSVSVEQRFKPVMNNVFKDRDTNTNYYLNYDRTNKSISIIKTNNNHDGLLNNISSALNAYFLRNSNTIKTTTTV